LPDPETPMRMMIKAENYNRDPLGHRALRRALDAHGA
jgi:hypothetical protein